jgi:hypothetical protein
MSSWKLKIIHLILKSNLVFLNRFERKSQLQNTIKILSLEAEIFLWPDRQTNGKQTDGQTGMATLIFTFRKFVTARTNGI